MSRAGHLTTIDEGGDAAAARRLLSAHAVRERAHALLDKAEALHHFTVHLDRLEAAADYVVETIGRNYPTLDIPFHARWRHFVIGGVDRWAQIAGTLDVDGRERARIRFDLAVTSVLLDAGAGPDWTYTDQTSGAVLSRSEGLALASLDMFQAGFFSSDPKRPLQADALGLQGVTTAALGAAFQVGGDNPLEGLDGRAALMNRLGAALAARPDMFGSAPARIGNVVDAIVARHGDRIAAGALLEVVLDAFGSIWPGRTEIAGVPLGDTWRHGLIEADDATTGLMPLHKLSQWLTYSLIEPLTDAGVQVENLDGLTGLAEYRNGGLMIDLGVLALRDPGAAQVPHAPDAELIVEWRALTVALLDRIAVIVRGKLGRTEETLPLASILEGGTWSAGRRIAAELRDGGPPPLIIVSDGSVF